MLLSWGLRVLLYTQADEKESEDDERGGYVQSLPKAP
jgi:hypothetical protein